MNTCYRPNILYYISYIFGIFISLFLINALNNIEKNIECKCRNNYNKDYIKEWFMFLILLNTILLLFFILSSYECYDIFMKENMNIMFILLIFIIQVIMMSRLFLYIRWLRDECECSYGNEQKFIYWYLLILFSIVLTILLILIFSLLILAWSI